MEKRLLLAFLLSFLVLSVWGVLNPRPKPEKGLETLEEMTSQEVLGTSVSGYEKHKPPISPEKSSPILVLPAQKEVKILENDIFLAEFSNIGGTLSKIILKEYGESLPISSFINLEGHEASEYQVQAITNNKIEYFIESQGLRVTKSYQLDEGNVLRTYVQIENVEKMSKKVDAVLTGITLDISRLDKDSENSRDQSLFEYSVATEKDTLRKGNATKFSHKNQKYEDGVVSWMGFRDRYFCAVVKPLFHSKSYEIKNEGEQVLKMNFSPETTELAPGGTVGYESVVFFGPQKLGLLKSYEMGFENIMKFSRFGLLDAISKGIYALMNIMHGIIPSWGFCIIIVSLLIYGAMYPLTMKGMKSMKRMQALQPKISQIRDQNKNNPQKLNKEIMELYKEYKINPLGGCFPLLLQMPVFIGLYQVLWRSVSFKGAEFLWIKDLSQPDRLMIFPFTLPVIGNELNILPILMIVVMALQQRISAKNMVITDPSQATQQKMMMTVFPVIIGFVFYKFASGLSLYFTVFYLLSTFTQWKMSKVTQVL